MILEVAVLNVRKNEEKSFEEAMAKAKKIISSMPGFGGMEVRKSLDIANQYMLHVKWETRAHHTDGFRQSAEYQDWRALLHHFYEPMPTVEYYSDPIISA
ncbi:MAG: antibiotic biosynthesis monooxygenase [Kordiimonas sp.]